MYVFFFICEIALYLLPLHISLAHFVIIILSSLLGDNSSKVLDDSLDAQNKPSTPAPRADETKEPNRAPELNPEPYDPYNPAHKFHIEESRPGGEDELDYENYDVKESLVPRANEGRGREVVEEDEHHLLAPVVNDHLFQPNSDNLPVFLLEPKNAYVIKSKPASLQCRAANALQVTNHIL